MKKAQLKLFSHEKSCTDHGGEARKGRRKGARPLTTKKPMHIVLRSKKAVDEKSFLRRGNQAQIEQMLDSLSVRYGIRVLKFQNVGNHLHLLIQGKSRALLQAFLRAFPAKVALAISGAKKGNPQGRFFEEIFFSRVVEWGRDIHRLKQYFFKNAMEADGWSKESIERWRNLAKTLPT